MTVDDILALFARVPVRFWPVLVMGIIRVSGEIEAALREGRSGWICYDRLGRVWLDLYPAPIRDWQDDLAERLTSDQRRMSVALCEGARPAPPVPDLRGRLARPLCAPSGAAPAPAFPDTS